MATKKAETTAKKAAKKTPAKAAAKSTAKTAAKEQPEEVSGGSSQKAKIVILVALVAVAGIIYLAMNAGALAKNTVERIASNSLGTKVSLATLDISLQEKAITVTGLNVANLPGYKHADAIHVDNIRISVEDMTKQLLTFDEIGVSGINVDLQVKEDTTNLTALRDSALARAAEKPKKEGAEATKVIIRKLNIDKAVLNTSAEALGGDMKPVDMPPIQITGIGERTNGALVSDAIAQVMDYVVNVAMRRSFEVGYLDGMSADSLQGLQQEFNLPLEGSFKDQMRDLGDKVKSMFGN